MTTKIRWLANLLLLLVTLVWGATFTLTKTATDTLPVFSFLSVRFIVASAVLWAMVVLSPRSRKAFSGRTVGLGVILGLFLFAVYAFQTLGLRYTTPAVAGFLTGLSVVLVPVLGTVLMRQRAGWRVWGGAALAAAGLFLLCGPGILQLAAGDVLVLLCAVFVALQILAIEKYGRNTDSLVLATIEISVVAFGCVAVAAWSPSTPNALVHGLHNTGVVWAILICAIPGTSLAYLAQNVFQKYTSSAQTAVIFSMEPVFAALIAWMALGEGFTQLTGLGSLFIFASMIVSDQSIPLGRRKVLLERS
ncbi:DMT family transporter [Alicyclobacillus tolerans]|uniref:DMT family transporter n=1 Tax=Alicyclobacillus tolerans TaxID=90970 RepID=UPI001F32743B|nr:DMT family transporter [Alicyclobacillus tolerans]MCF8563533.1 DMT family transporter [Alicyclobacillus tolerans]